LVVDGPRAEGLLDHKRLGPSAWQLMLTTAGMVGVVNSAVIGACAGLAVETLPIGSFVVVLMAGSITGAVTLLLHRRHHLRARNAYTAEGIDRAAIFGPVAQEAGAV
jgi:NhaP-type Na+/H+ or K+/H+ antiporter